MANLDLHDRKWLIAKARWEDGDPTALEAKMRGSEPVPEEVRPWLADLITGKAKKKRGRKKVHEPLSVYGPQLVKEFAIREAFQRWLMLEQAREGDEPDTPTARALAKCAEKFDLNEDQVSKIVFPRKA